MIIMIHGGTHTGKTNLSQQLINTLHYPMLSIDHLKMGLIRSNYTNLTVEDDKLLTDYLWPIVREMIKTAIENKQNLIVEGVYIPFTYKEDFEEEYLQHITSLCLIMSESYILQNYQNILDYASIIEERLDDSYLSKDDLIMENKENLNQCIKNNLDYIMIDEKYDVKSQWNAKLEQFRIK